MFLLQCDAVHTLIIRQRRFAVKRYLIVLLSTRKGILEAVLVSRIPEDRAPMRVPSPRSQASKSLPAALACFSWSCTKWRTIRFVSTSLRLLTGGPHEHGRPSQRPREFGRRTSPYPSCWRAHP